jgi:putative phosphonate metabolism protein
MTARYALYAAPAPKTPLWRFGSSVIGYDAASASEMDFLAGAPCDAPDWRELTEDPRRYGFHGTLKAPFALAAGTSEADLLEAAMLFAERRRAFTLPALKVALIGAFVALVPDGAAPDLDTLAADCVRDFDAFRAPLTEVDRERRLRAPLSARQVANLDAWGYPHVFEDFRFHMTLTGRLAEARREPVRAALAERYRELAAPMPVDALCVFRQPDRAGRFSILARFPFEA